MNRLIILHNAVSAGPKAFWHTCYLDSGLNAVLHDY